MTEAKEEKLNIEDPEAKVTQEESVDMIDVPKDKDLEDMFKAGVHFGYSRGKRHPKMAQYLFGIRNNVEVFDLAKIKPLLDEAMKFIEKLASEDKKIIFVGTKPAIKDVVEKTAQDMGAPYVKERWLGGFITNFNNLRKRMDYLEGLRVKQSSGELEKYTKKEQLNMSKEMEKLNKHFGSLLSLKKLPDALFVIDPKEERTAVREAVSKNIPVIAILNSDIDPRDIDYIIPGNDSSVSSVSYLLSKITEAYQRGFKNVKK